MSVFTTVPPEVLNAWLVHYPLGALRDYQGIAAGITNTNYALETERGRYVLTLFERLRHDDLPYYIDLMVHLAAAGLPCPQPIARCDGVRIDTLCGKPTVILSWLPGASVDEPTAAQCRALGEMLARMHIAGQSFPSHRPNPRGIDWMRATAQAVQHYLDPVQHALLAAALAELPILASPTLPRGAVHADLFRENVLMGLVPSLATGTPAAGEPAQEDAVLGLIDFYYAATDTLVYDLAIACNDWCVHLPAAGTSGRLDSACFAALQAGYSAQRVLTAEEAAAWPAARRVAALRFWLSRLADWHHPAQGELVYRKDPAVFERILRLTADTPW